MAKKAKTRLTFSVTLTMPLGENIPGMREYIREAIQSHRGGMDPNEPVFNTDFSDMRVHLTNKEVSYA